MIATPPTLPQKADYLASMLTDARNRSLALLRDILDLRELGPQLKVVNPPLWELGHVGFFHDHFALRELYQLPEYQLVGAESLFDSAKIAHAERWRLAIASRQVILDYLGRVQQAMLAHLPDGGLASSTQSYVYQLTTLHEDMHCEAFTYTRQTLGDPPPRLDGAESIAAVSAGALPGDVSIPAGRHRLGSDESVPFRFDNEKPVVELEVPAFSIARAPVTNREFAAFVDDGGYDHPAFWSEAGWQWRAGEKLYAPIYWRKTGAGEWRERVFDRWLPLASHHPVAHVNYFEAEAWCAWAGRRLPSEVEWEVAASRAPRDNGKALEDQKRPFPWGSESASPKHANLDGWHLGRVDVAALPEGDSAFGCRQMLGNVWEWTSTPFAPFPGFKADLYREYSAPWFAEGRRVLRGGAWATRARLIHNGYRNFFTPERQDILSGFRTCPLEISIAKP